MNEGHSAFLALERIRVLMREHKLTFDEALEAARVEQRLHHAHVGAGRHRSVRSRPDVPLLFRTTAPKRGIDFEQSDGAWAAAIRRIATSASRWPCWRCKTSAYRNAVSRLHRQVSQEMWQDLWPQLPVWEVPITSITNGVHLPSWLNGDLAALYDQYLQPDWRERFNDHAIWEQVRDIPDEELREAHRRRKRRLVSFVRARQTVGRRAPARPRAGECGVPAKCSIPNAFTIGFARRFATYKRATLLFRDVERLKRILLQQGHAGADRDRRQGASQGSARARP